MLKAMQLASDGHELDLNWPSDQENGFDPGTEGKRWHPPLFLTVQNFQEQLLPAANFRVRDLARH